MRCVALAHALASRGWQCRFVVAAPGSEAVRRLAGPTHEVHAIPPSAAPDPASLMQVQASCDLLIVDHYGWSTTQERACRGWARRILAIDDLCERVRDCDLLLHVGLERARNDYAPRVPEGCRIMTGAGYALLREQFPRRRIIDRRARSSQPVSRVFVGFGFADAANLSEQALDALDAAGYRGVVDLAIGFDAPHVERLRATARRVPFQLQLHLEPDNVAELMAAADLAVGAAGGSAWERCCLALPSVAVSAAANQDHNARTLSMRGACELTRSADLAIALRELLHDPARIAQMARAAAAITDGRGAARTALAIDPERTRTGDAVSLRRVTVEDAAQLHEWQCHPDTRRHARKASAPSSGEHRAWLAQKLSDPACVLDVIEYNGIPAGAVRLDRASEPGMPITCEVSIYVSPQLYGRGIATAALAALRRVAPEADFVAHVLPENAASHMLFVRAGYELQDGVYVSRATAGGGA